MRHWMFIGALLLAVPGHGATAAESAKTRLVVVELFTSQGCSSCPPANANLIRLMNQPNVLALSFSVTYWDRLGWKDVFGKPEFTQRQAAYEPALGEPSLFTPQMVIQGRISRVGSRFSEVEAAIAAAPALTGPDIGIGPEAITLGSGAAPRAPADVWLVSYDPKVVEVPVRRGENAGQTLPHGRVVHALTRIGAWDGRGARLARPPEPEGLRTAILIQGPGGGPILAAATD